MTKLLILALTFGMTLTACNRGSGSLVGIWVNTDGLEKLFRSNGTWEVTIDGVPNTRGTYTVRGNTITRKMTHLHGSVFEELEPIWYSESELGSFVTQSMADPESSAFVFYALLPFDSVTEIYTYSISGNTVTFTYTDAGIDENQTVTQIFTRK